MPEQIENSTAQTLPPLPFPRPLPLSLPLPLALGLGFDFVEGVLVEDPSRVLSFVLVFPFSLPLPPLLPPSLLSFVLLLPFPAPFWPGF